ncbi:secreted frizzled-related protein 2-like [Hoplias malabaricus]|uniref:secreted frizzled-related protein 2-like n=1 Tax=Hoplias malabaricus TaxID=27720 RepID=UPI0034629CE4
MCKVLVKTPQPVTKHHFRATDSRFVGMASPSMAFFLVLGLVSHINHFKADKDIGLDGVVANTVSDFVTSTEFSSTRSVCKPVPSTMGLCYGVGYESMRLPNLLGHESVREAQQQAAAWTPLVGKHCHKDTRRFLCSLLAPACLDGISVPVPPCRSLCSSVRDGCLPVMTAFGFPWPQGFNCSRFPSKDQLCIPRAEDSGRVEDATDKGTVLCDACSPASEAESEILMNFCHSQFAFRLLIGSWTLEGVDLRVVPQGKSRILRWEGSEEEQQVAMQQSALWLLEGTNCSCQALEEKTAGHSLALGGIQDGRMVLSRLVRWSHSEKDLKKFVRKLTRLQC